jgi:hypothetical protein
MERKDINKDKIEENIEWIHRNAAGNPVILKSVPTKPSDLKSNTIGKHANKIYFRTADGVLIELTGTIIP